MRQVGGSTEINLGVVFWFSATIKMSALAASSVMFFMMLSGLRVRSWCRKLGSCLRCYVL